MVFPKPYAEIAARTRVPAGAVLAVAFLLLARPSWQSLAIGGPVALLGLLLRGWAAGHLAKYDALTISGPYAYTRNPLYLGTLVSAAGCAVAGSHVGIAVVAAAFFILFYLPVIEEEEGYLRETFDGYAAYQKRVAKFLPALRSPGRPTGGFRLALYKRNREVRALIAFGLVFAVLTAKLFFSP